VGSIENTPEQAAIMKLRSELMIALKDHLARRNEPGVCSPAIRRGGKIDLFALDALVNMAATAGLRIEMRVREAA
jgi:predicted XRE-type DNA-binding protein